MDKLIRVFISYAHESDAFKEQVNELTSWLNKNGEGKIIVTTDYEHSYKAPKKGWQVWMQDQVEDSDIVLIVCSPKYIKRFRKKEDPQIGRGAKFEGSIITQELYDAESENEKFIPIIPDGGNANDVPKILRPFFNYFSFPTNNDKILKCILNEKPTLTNGDYNSEIKSFVSCSINNYEELIVLLRNNDGRNTNFLHRFTQGERHINDIQVADRILSLLEVLKAFNVSRLNNEAQDKYGSIIFDIKMNSNESIGNIIDKASLYAKELEFDKAHALFSKALKRVDLTEQQYDFLYKEYLTTGFIWYSRDNDINGLRSLLHTKSNITIDKNSDIGYILSMIYQEIFTRDIDLDGLRDATSSLHTSYNTASSVIKSAMANSLGLAYRRLGERTGVLDLEKAIVFFREGLEFNKDDKTMEVELKDQMAITHIRIFEFNNIKGELNEAERLLIDCLKLLKQPLHPKYYRLKPRVLNNYGNVHKQRVLKLKDLESASKALACYKDAEEYWNEKDANYDWALLRKNTAETKYALGKMTHDVDLLLQAGQESIESTRYRTLKNSPYQWGKSVEIAFSVIITLNEMHSLKRISKSLRNKILLSSNIIMKDEIKWHENLSPRFVQIAQQAQSLLQGLD